MDAGPERYGIEAHNEARIPLTLRVRVTQPFAGEETGENNIFEKEREFAPDERRSWDGVITETGVDHAVDFLAYTRSEEFRGRYRAHSTTLWITPGGDRAPDVPDVGVTAELLTESADSERVWAIIAVGDRMTNQTPTPRKWG